MKIHILLSILIISFGIEEALAKEKVCPDPDINLTGRSVTFCSSTNLDPNKARESAIAIIQFSECPDMCKEEKCQHNFPCELKGINIPPLLEENSGVESDDADPSCDGTKFTVTFDKSEYYSTACACGCSLKIELISFEATRTTNGVSVRWETGTECNTSKFVLWRAKPLNGICTDNQSNYLSPVSLLEVPARGGNNQGDRYPYKDGLPYIDKTGNDEFCYGLQEIENDGKWNLHVIGVE